MIGKMKILDGKMADLGIDKESEIEIRFDIEDVCAWYTHEDYIFINVSGIEYPINYSEDIFNILLKSEKFK